MNIFYTLKAPSVTTKSYLNPGYRIHEVGGNYEGSSWQLIDHHTKILILTDT
jgi:sphingomyelin phosphodiesterase